MTVYIRVTPWGLPIVQPWLQRKASGEILKVSRQIVKGWGFGYNLHTWDIGPLLLCNPRIELRPQVGGWFKGLDYFCYLDTWGNGWKFLSLVPHHDSSLGIAYPLAWFNG